MHTIQYRLINREDAKQLSLYHLANEEHFKPWSPARPLGFNRLAEWEARLEDILPMQRAGKAYTFVAVESSSQSIVAHCSLSQIFYGPFRACYMGYGIDQRYEGAGVMRAFCRYVIDFAFDELKLNRIMANYMPHNNRSARLLKQLGFTWEGRASRYLEINGRWEDHMLTALTNPRLND
ncbi:Putative ribosomal N-acetyltransferase YdaF [Thalassocella blandensis]|nr:Putative ribosomal N-acetyltransferase YdaF [Thalassocella blandensis]